MGFKKTAFSMNEQCRERMVISCQTGDPGWHIQRVIKAMVSIKPLWE
jgi:hypothetical protein